LIEAVTLSAAPKHRLGLPGLLGPAHQREGLPELCQVDGRHSAPADHALDGVAARERGAEQCNLIGWQGRLRRHSV